MRLKKENNRENLIKQLFFRKSNKVDKSLYRLTKRKRRHIINIRYETEDITTDSPGVKKIKRNSMNNSKYKVLTT